MGIDIGLDVNDIRHPTSTSLIPISEQKMSDLFLSFRYRNSSDIDINFHSDIGLNQYRIFRYLKLIIISSKMFGQLIFLSGFEPTTLVTSIWQSTTALQRFTHVDVGYRTKDYSDIRYNVGTLRSSVRYRTFRYPAQSDIADHGYRTECPPMPMECERHWFSWRFFKVVIAKIKTI